MTVRLKDLTPKQRRMIRDAAAIPPGKHGDPAGTRSSTRPRSVGAVPQATVWTPDPYEEEAS